MEKCLHVIRYIACPWVPVLITTTSRSSGPTIYGPNRQPGPINGLHERTVLFRTLGWTANASRTVYMCTYRVVIHHPKPNVQRGSLGSRTRARRQAALRATHVLPWRTSLTVDECQRHQRYHTLDVGKVSGPKSGPKRPTKQRRHRLHTARSQNSEEIAHRRSLDCTIPTFVHHRPSSMPCFRQSHHASPAILSTYDLVTL